MASTPSMPGMPQGRLPVFVRVGYGFVPIQEYGEKYNLAEALRRGTLFPVLDIPWTQYVPQIPGGES